MITPKDCLKKYGQPTPAFERKWMKVITLAPEIHWAIKPFPLKIYMNRDMEKPFIDALCRIMAGGLYDKIVEWGGCFNIRFMRGTNTPSIHSWGIAFDINMTGNEMGQFPVMPQGLVDCFTQAGFDWGGDWALRVDGMHFQLSEI